MHFTPNIYCFFKKLHNEIKIIQIETHHVDAMDMDH